MHEMAGLGKPSWLPEDIYRYVMLKDWRVLGFRDLRFRGLEFQGVGLSGFRDLGLGFRVYGLGF